MMVWINKLRGENSVKGATAILIVTLFLSNLLGIIRDHFLAQKIPTSTLDTYFAAFRLPDLVFNVLILGAISAAFVPVFSGLISQQKKDDAWKLVSDLLGIGIILLVSLLIIFWFWMPLFVNILVPDFDSSKQLITLNLARLFLLSPLFFGISYLLTGVLNSQKKFFYTSMAPLVYNISIISGAILFSDKYGVYAIGWSVVVGALLHMMIQIPDALRSGFKFKFTTDLSNTSLRKVGKLLVPRAIALGSNQILLIIFTAIASGLGGGAVAMYNLSDNIQTMPTVIFGNSVALALFPSLAAWVSNGQMDEFGSYLRKAIATIALFLIPASAGVFLLRVQIVRIVLGSGHFSWFQTVTTAQILGVFSLSLVFTGLIPLIARAFYAMHNTKTPMYTSVISVIVSIIISYYASRNYGVVGLAYGYTIGTALNALLLFYLISKKVPDLNEKTMWIWIFKMILASCVMVVAVQITKYIIGDSLTPLDRFYKVGLQTVIASLVGAGVYGITLMMLKLDQFEIVGLDRIISRISGRRDGR